MGAEERARSRPTGGKILAEDINRIYSTVGPASSPTWSEFSYGIRAVTRSRMRVTWVPADFPGEIDVAACVSCEL